MAWRVPVRRSRASAARPVSRRRRGLPRLSAVSRREPPGRFHLSARRSDRPGLPGHGDEPRDGLPGRGGAAGLHAARRAARMRPHRTRDSRDAEPRAGQAPRHLRDLDLAPRPAHGAGKDGVPLLRNLRAQPEGRCRRGGRLRLSRDAAGSGRRAGNVPRAHQPGAEGPSPSKISPASAADASISGTGTALPGWLASRTTIFSDAQDEGCRRTTLARGRCAARRLSVG